MKTIELLEKLAGGVDQTWSPDSNSASEIVNMRQDDKGFGWIADRGYEPLIPLGVGIARVSTRFIEPLERLFIWDRHNTSEEYYIEKSKTTGDLRYRVANTTALPTVQDNYHFIAFDRSLAKANDAGEQFIPAGRFCTILNGEDPIIKFYGRDHVEPFGFIQKTPSPDILGVDTDYFKGNLAGESDSASIHFTNDFSAGVGTEGAGAVNTFRYKVSFITRSGSESPLSDSSEINWTNFTGGSGGGFTHGVFINDLPIGPPGTVKRRIYRTKNIVNFKGAGDVLYYFLTEVEENVSKTFLDAIPDSLLTTLSPSLTDSSVIAGTQKYGAAFNGRMWLAGGAGNESRIIYSKQGLLEQFPTFNYFDVGATSGGAITQIYAYYDNLLVFRENAIDIIRSRGNGDQYSLSTLIQGIGTTASNTIKTVPGYGVMFLSYDGIYLISGGTLGGSQTSVKRVSDKVHKEMSRISVNSLARSSATYSHKEQEYWVIYPVDGNTLCSRGTVFHSLTGQYSLRHKQKDDGDTGTFEFNDISTNTSGWIILAPESTRVNAGQNITSSNAGLQVWSAADINGASYSLGFVDTGIYSVGTANRPRGKALWSSVWEDFGDDSEKKRISSVDILMIADGNDELELEYAVDWKETYLSGGTAPITIPEKYGTTSSENILGPTTNAKDKNKATTDTSLWSQKSTTRVRWDVQTGGIDEFKFRIKSNRSFQIISYKIHYTPINRKVIKTRAGE